MGGVSVHRISLFQEFIVSQIVIIAIFSHALWRSPSLSPHYVTPFVLILGIVPNPHSNLATCTMPRSFITFTNAGLNLDNPASIKAHIHGANILYP
ncbi:hypothetical protein Hypma_003121 [Hypsizygus marmoreus]|uniref:Uncharacterized protein n=1 Tax=Hypsizygus marmoreus TaxID=39966 RepID=A0A369J6I8_HYPMA|nr:hypothetical protein Hypma_003121 [Hypsizygus marmoreus]